MKELVRIELTCTKRDERCEAASIKKMMDKFEFIISLVFWERILQVSNIFSKTVHSATCDLNVACKLLETSIQDTCTIKQNYQSVYHAAIVLAKRFGTSTEFEKRRTLFRKQHFDELALDKNLESSYEKLVFIPVCEIVIKSLKKRFAGMRSISEKFAFLNPLILFDEEQEDFIIRSAKDFVIA